MILRQALIESFNTCMDSGRCKAADIVADAQHRHPELFFRESERLILKAALREAKTIMAQSGVTVQSVTQANQLELPLGILPGLRPPLALAVELPESPGEYEYVRYDCATWSDLESALQEKTLNVERAIARREDHLTKMDALRAIMATHPEMAVAEACELLRKEATP